MNEKNEKYLQIEVFFAVNSHPNHWSCELGLLPLIICIDLEKGDLDPSYRDKNLIKRYHHHDVLDV
jgi:hypothetical protein